MNELLQPAPVKTTALSIIDFEEWLNANRDQTVSSIFHDAVGHYALRQAEQEPVAAPDGYELAHVFMKGLGPLIDALERAESKGHLPDAICDEWANFDILPAPYPAPVQPGANKDAEVDSLLNAKCAEIEALKLHISDLTLQLAQPVVY